ncbi:MAG: PA0069 family radical SAM protein [Pirellulaceae bacterium]
MDGSSEPTKVGRGAQIRPANRFEAIHLESDWEQLSAEDADEPSRKIKTSYYIDDSKSIVSQNSSPDVPFNFSMNPYRGCVHGCSYCYARPGHEYLGLDAGLDFESKILVKLQAADLFRTWLRKKSWRCEPIALSGVTDCYQPAERHFRITRSLIQVAVEASQPLTIITKNRLITRDLDLLAKLAADNLVHAAVSITSLDQNLTKQLEPRTSAPAARLQAIRELTEVGVPVSVMVAPVIPGLNDQEIPAILEQAAAHGATAAGYVMLRLPLTVEPIFIDWLQRFRPLQADKVISRLRSVRAGELNESQFGQRMRGTGVMANQLTQLFDVFAKKHNLANRLPPLDCTKFTPPASADGQLRLF